ncbi:MAG TPA: 50S ribosomal protein L10 [Candidatus Brocadiia bacterium]|nr:50S ribosomal protein L10 [Candidatus Brocadiia bacterium]
MVNRLNRYVVSELGGQFRGMNHCVVVNYQGLTSQESVDLRSALRASKVRMRVVKNALAGIALEEAGFKGLKDLLKGQCALAVGEEDMPTTAKAVTEWIKKNKKMEVRGGFVEGQMLDAAGVQKMASVPSRQVLMGMFVGGVLGVLQRVAGTFQGVQSSLARALSEIEKQKQAAAGAAAPAAEQA